MNRSKSLLHMHKMTGVAGSENFLLKLGRGLNDRGWKLHFGLIEEANQPADQAYRELTESGWEVERFNYRPGFLLTLLPSIRSWIKRIEPDLINTHLIHADLLGALASTGLSVPLVTTKHNDDQFKQSRFYGFFARAFNRRFHRGVTISRHLKEFYEEELGVESPAFETIHYGLDPEEFQSGVNQESGNADDDTVRFGIVARLTEQKGHSTLLKAFKRVKNYQENTSLTIIGNGPLEGRLKTLTQNLKLEDSVTFQGYREDVDRAMAELDVFVHPSRWEGFGLVFLEAMASSLPVIATGVSAIPEIVRHNKTGFLVEPDNEESLAGAMKRVARNPELREKLGQAGRRRVQEEFSVEKMVDRYEDFYQRVIGTFQ